MSDARAYLVERQRLADAATEGPWEARPHSSGDPSYGPQEYRIVSLAKGEDAHTRAGDLYGPVVASADYSEMGYLDSRFAADARSSVPAMAAALTAVLDLHVAERWEWDDSIVCSRCGPEDAPHEWPCETVRAIEAALGGEE